MRRRRHTSGGPDLGGFQDDLDRVPGIALVIDGASRVRGWNRTAANVFAHGREPLAATTTIELLGRTLRPAGPAATTDGVDVLVDQPDGPPIRARALVGPPDERTDHAVVLVIPEHHAASRTSGAPRVEPWIDVATRARRLGPQAVCAVVGLIGLERINEAFSRSTGDRTLDEIRHRLELLVSSGSVVARIAANRLAVVTDASDGAATDLGQRIVDAVRPAIDTDLGRVAVGCSVGIAIGDARSGLILLDVADRRLESALELGAGLVVDDGDQHERADRSGGAKLAGTLVDAVGTADIGASYQPVVDLSTGGVVELEALARWHTVDQGRLRAAEFLAAAEFTGTIVDVGTSVVSAALEQLTSVRAHLGPDHRLRMSVNMSLREFLEPNLTATLGEHLAHHELGAGDLQLELTGPIRPDVLPQVRTQSRAVRDTGMRVVLDSFGGSATDLLVLREVSVDGIKLDAALVGDLSAGTRGERFVRGVLDLARHLDLDVIAKGVEQVGQHRQLRQLGCRYAQGYLYGRPVPGEGVLDVVTQLRRLEPPPAQVETHRRIDALVAAGALDHIHLDPMLQTLARATGADLAAVVVAEHDDRWIAARHDPIGITADRSGTMAMTSAAGDGLGSSLAKATSAFDATVGAAPWCLPVEDRRLLDHGIVIHAGAPITSDDGMVLGAVVIASRHADLVDDDVVDHLADGAREVANQLHWLLELRRHHARPVISADASPSDVVPGPVPV